MVLQYLSYIFRGIAEVSGYANLGWLLRTRVQKFPHIAGDLRGSDFVSFDDCLLSCFPSQQFLVMSG